MKENGNGDGKYVHTRKPSTTTRNWFFCSYCSGNPSGFATEKKLHDHIVAHHTGQFVPDVPCLHSSCNLSFKEVADMKSHYRLSHFKDDMYKCSYEGQNNCSGFSSKRKKLLDKHLLKVHGKICDNCKKRFPDKKLLLQHRRCCGMQMNKELFKEGKNLAGLKKKMINKCQFCGEVLPKCQDLSDHLTKHIKDLQNNTTNYN